MFDLTEKKPLEGDIPWDFDREATDMKLTLDFDDKAADRNLGRDFGREATYRYFTWDFNPDLLCNL